MQKSKKIRITKNWKHTRKDRKQYIHNGQVKCKYLDFDENGRPYESVDYISEDSIRRDRIVGELKCEKHKTPFMMEDKEGADEYEI